MKRNALPRCKDAEGNVFFFFRLERIFIFFCLFFFSSVPYHEYVHFTITIRINRWSDRSSPERIFFVGNVRLGERQVLIIYEEIAFLFFFSDSARAHAVSR